MNNLFLDEYKHQDGLATKFFDFTTYKRLSVFVAPKICNMLREKLLPSSHDEDPVIISNKETAWIKIMALIEDGFQIIGDADYNNDYMDIEILAQTLSLRNPGKEIFIVLMDNEKDKVRTYKNVFPISIDKIIEDFDLYDEEYRKLKYGS